MNVVEQYRALLERENANTDRGLKLKIRLEGLGKLIHDEKIWESSKKIAIIERMQNEFEADFKQWREEHNQIQGDTLALGIEINKTLAEDSKKN